MEDVTDFSTVAPEDRADLRDALVDQMRYLRDEVEALRTVVSTVPEDVQSGRPLPDDLTMKEIYGVIATLDREVRPDRIRAAADGDAPSVASVDEDALIDGEGWNDRPMDTVLDALQDARNDLLRILDDVDLDAWTQTATLDGETMTLFELVHRMAKADVERMRTLGHRLHDADLTKREE